MIPLPELRALVADINQKAAAAATAGPGKHGASAIHVHIEVGS